MEESRGARGREAALAVRIAQRRVQRLHTHLIGVPADAVLTPAILDVHRHTLRLREIGVAPEVAAMRPVLPAAVGPRSRFNAAGHEPRRPRDSSPLAPPPDVRLSVIGRGGRAWAVIGERLRRGRQDDRLLHSVNLFLELFGECDVLWEGGAPAGGRGERSRAVGTRD